MDTHHCSASQNYMSPDVYMLLIHVNTWCGAGGPKNPSETFEQAWFSNIAEWFIETNAHFTESLLLKIRKQQDMFTTFYFFQSGKPLELSACTKMTQSLY